MSAVLAGWDGPTSTLTWLRCGHPAPAVWHAERGLRELEGGDGPVLGLDRLDPPTQTASTRIAPDELVVLVSDGVLERTAPDGRVFGEDGLRRALEAMVEPSAIAAASAILEAVATSDGPLRDDASVVVLAALLSRGTCRAPGAVVAGMELDRRAFVGLGLAALPALAGWRAPAGREPLALATADTEAHVVVVGLARGQVQRRVATVEDPRSIESGPGGHVVVAHPAAGAVSLLTTRPVRVRRVLRGLGAPRYTALAPDGRHAFVSDGGRGELVVVDLARGRIVAGVEVGAGARHLSLDPAGRTLWVALGRAPRRSPWSTSAIRGARACAVACARRSWPMTWPSPPAAGACGSPPGASDAWPCCRRPAGAPCC